MELEFVRQDAALTDESWGRADVCALSVTLQTPRKGVLGVWSRDQTPI